MVDRKISITLLSILIASSSSYAAPLPAFNLRSICEHKRDRDDQICISYFIGFVEGVFLSRTSPHNCVPAALDLSQLISTYMAETAGISEQAQISAAEIIQKIVSRRAYTCDPD